SGGCVGVVGRRWWRGDDGLGGDDDGGDVMNLWCGSGGGWPEYFPVAAPD
nr:hypothetical protein [Tanacetum cinerariifolium]